ncbi:MAG: hybrid sensor histidine kinase/response regulator [Acidobacteria bacterium]|nr:MAG: hybrid sensor histidine kinase/response regulator [Acidobacteriota bacterium]
MSASDVEQGRTLPPAEPEPIQADARKYERRQWALSFTGVAVALLLTLGIVSFYVSVLIPQLNSLNVANLGVAIRALVAMVLLFDVYVIYQQLQIHRFRVRLAEREELFRLISENAADMIAVVSVDGQRLYNSPSYERALGYTAEELVRTASFEQIHPEDRASVKAAAQETRRTGVGCRLEYRIRHKRGDWRVFESTSSAVRNANGETEKLVIVNRDITERKQLEQQLYLSQKLEAVGRLSGGVAHDFNNLLGVIIGYSEVMQKRMAPNDRFREAADEILKAAHRAAALTKQLLAFSRKQVLEPKVLDLNTVVADVEKMLKRLIGEDILLEILVSPDLHAVKADPGQIGQVIMNLAVNARDAMPNGGKLTIETANTTLDEKDAGRYRYVVPGQYVKLRVSDTGCGMDAETQSHVFEPFFTTKEKGKGTGLGLATVYGVVKQSGGYIWLQSDVGKGTQFEIFLPRVEGEIEKPQKASAPAKESRGGQTILVVEDEQALRKLTSSVLQDLGYTVLEAGDAAEALALVKQCKPAVDLLLTDVVMPGKSGRDLADELVPQIPGMKVLFMSGYTDGAIAAHRVLEPGLSLLRKPFSSEELTQTVARILAGEAEHGEAAAREERHAESESKTI